MKIIPKKIILLIFRGLYIDCASLKIIILYNYNDSLHECVMARNWRHALDHNNMR